MLDICKEFIIIKGKIKKAIMVLFLQKYIKINNIIDSGITEKINPVPCVASQHNPIFNSKLVKMIYSCIVFIRVE